MDIETLFKKLDGANQETVAEVQWRLRKESRAEDVPTLLTQAVAANPKVRETALFGLSLHKDPRVLPSLQAALNDPERDVRRTAAASLVWNNAPVSALLPLLQNAELRDNAILGLCELGDTSTLPALLPLLRDPKVSSTVKAPIVRFVAHVEQPEAIPYLGELLRAEGLMESRLADLAVRAISRFPEAACEAALSLLKAPNPNLRRRALAVVAASRCAKAIPGAIDALTDADYGVKQSALSALAEVGMDAVDPLLRAVADQSDKDGLVQAVADVLKEIGPSTWDLLEKHELRAKPGLQELHALLLPAVNPSMKSAGGPSSARELVEALMASDLSSRKQKAAQAAMLKTPELVHDLIALLDDTSPDVRWFAAWILGDMQASEAYEPLIRLLARPDAKTEKWKAVGGPAYALGEIGDVRAVGPLANALKHEVPQIRLTAADALGKLEDVRAVEPLIDMMLHGPKGSPTWRAAAALGPLGDFRAIEPLKQVVKGNEDFYFRLAAASSLHQLGDPLGLFTMEEMSRSEDQQQRGMAEHTLRELRDSDDEKGKEAEKLLKQLQDAPDMGADHTIAIRLGEIADAKIVERMIEIFESLAAQSHAHFKRQAIMKGLAVSDMPQAKEYLLRALRSPHLEHMALWILEGQRDPRFVEPLLSALDDPLFQTQSVMRKIIAKDLAWLDHPAVSECLHRALQDADVAIVEGAHAFYIRHAVQGSEPLLLEAIEETDDLQMALNFYHSGHEPLTTAGARWLRTRGHPWSAAVKGRSTKVAGQPMSQPQLKWGSSKA